MEEIMSLEDYVCQNASKFKNYYACKVQWKRELRRLLSAMFDDYELNAIKELYNNPKWGKNELLDNI